MIIKHNNINKLDISKNNFVLLHGKNEGLKNDVISEFILNNRDNEVFKYDEKEIT